MSKNFNLKSFYSNNKKDILSLSFLTIFMLILTTLLLNIDIKIGVYYIRDVFGYLNTALYFAGYNSGLVNLRGLSPFLPFITSIFFRLGFISDSTIMIISGAFYILAVLGFYSLMRLRFKQLNSLLGAILIATFSINLSWATKGMLDLPALALSIWSVYFMLLGIKRNSKFYYLAFPTVIIGFFTKYAVVFIIPVMIMAILFLDKPLEYLKKEYKNFIGGIIAGSITTGIFLLAYQICKLPLFFLSQSQTISGESSFTSPVVASTAPKVINNVFYYLNNLLIYMQTFNNPPYSVKSGFLSISKMGWLGGDVSCVSYLLGAILIIGLLIYLKQLFNKNNLKIIFTNEIKTYSKIIIVIASFTIFFLTFQKISIIESLIIFTIGFLFIYRLLYKVNIKNMDLDFIFAYWFLINFIFFTYHIIKVGRYAITFTPALAYFIVLGICLIIAVLKNTSKINYSKLKIIIPTVLIIILTLSTAVCLMNTPTTFDNNHPANILNASSDEKNIANYIINTDSNYTNKTIWADRGGDFSFFLMKNIPSEEKFSQQANFTKSLERNNVTYFIADKNNLTLTNYKIIKQYGNVTLYEKI